MLESILTFISTIAWPLVVLIVFLCFGKKILDKFPSVEKLSYKQLAIHFSQVAERAKNFLPLVKTDVEYESYITALDPRETVLSAWTQIERSCVKKYIELSRKDVSKDVSPNQAIDFFEYTGALTPNAEKSLSELRWLHRQMEHPVADYISQEAATAFLDASISLRAQIDAMTSTPSVYLGLLTLLIFQYNKLLDTSSCDNITIPDVYAHIEDGTILRYIQERAERTGESFDVSLHLKATADEQSFEEYYSKYLRAFLGGYGRGAAKKWGVQNKGLCLLIAWTNEIIQQGGGWVPSDDVAGLHD